MRYSEIKEARRGGDSNPKVGEPDIIKSLDSYSRKPNEYYYMSYTAIDKLGINPRSGYNTPVGIYSYPLTDTIMNDIETSGLNLGVPYMGAAPYIWLFKPKNVGNGLILDEYRSRDFEVDRDKLYSFVSGRDSRITDAVFDRIVDYSFTNSNFKYPAGHLWNLTRILSMILVGDRKLARFTGEVLGINGLVLDGDRIAIINDVFDDTDEYEIEFADYSVDVVDFDMVKPMPEVGDEYSELFDELKDLRYKEEFKYAGKSYNINGLFPKYGVISLIDTDSNRLFVMVDDFLMYNPSYGSTVSEMGDLKFKVGDLVRLSNPKATPRHRIVGINVTDEIVILEPISGDKSPFKWSFSRLYKGNPELVPDVSESIVLEYKSDSVKAKSSAVMWTYLLYRVLGYDYVDDSEGLGIIHGNEPVQAVFFGRQVIEVAERFVNPSSTYGDKSELTFSSVFSKKSPEEIEKIDQKLLNNLFRKYLKKSNFKFSIGLLPPIYRGHIVLNSDKLKAQIILRDYGMMDYFKTVGDNVIRIMDKMIINRINNLVFGEEDLYPIWRYFNRIHDGRWPEGEQAILNKGDKHNAGGFLVNYIMAARQNRRWPEAESIILKDPKSIPVYASTILKNRWPEGERVLKRIDPVRGKWILEQYAQDFGISVSDIGNI